MPGLETGTIIALSISGGLTLVSTALSYFTKPNLRSEEELNRFDKNITDPNEFISVVYGKARLGVNRIFFETLAQDINTLFGVGSICHGEIDGIEKVWFDSDELIAKSNVSGVLEIVKKFDGYVRFETRNGTDTQQVVNFIRKQTTGWTSKHRGRGIALLAMRLSYNQNIFPTGIPTTTLLAKGQKVRDPRNLADPSNATQAEWDALTLAWSDNPSLCALDYLMSSRYGIGSPASRVDFQSFCDIANYCDTVINTSNYIEPPHSCKAELIKSKLELTKNTSYYYKYSFVKESGADYYEREFESELSPVSNVLTLTSLKGKIRLSNIEISSDPTITHRNIYRSISLTGTYYYVGMLDDNTSTTFIDNMSDKNAEKEGYHSPINSGTNPQTACIATFINLQGNLTANKLYKYKIAFVNTAGQETEAGDASNRVKTDSEYRAIYLSNIFSSEDENIAKRKIYRTTGYNAGDVIPDYKLVYTLEDNTTQSWEDTIADANLGTIALSNFTLYTGNFKLYTCNGVVDTSKEVDSNVEDILSSCRGSLYYSGGKYKVSIRRVIMPESIKLNEDNIIGDWEWSTPGFKETCNIISAEWRNPKENWQYEPFIWPKAGEENQYLIDDNNFENIREIRLPFTTVKKQAKVIAQIIRKESRQQIRCQVTVKEEGLNFEFNSLVYITNPTPGWADKLFWVDEVGILQSGSVRLALTEYDSTSYDLTTINKDTLDGSDTTLPDPRLPPSEVTGVKITQELFLDESIPNWRLKVTYTDPIDAFWHYSNVYIKTGTTSNYELYTKINKQSNGCFYIQPIVVLATYYIKIASVSTLMVEQDIEDVAEYVKTVAPPTPDAVTDLEIENRGSNNNVFGSSFKLRWSHRSSLAPDGKSNNSYAHQQISVFNENIQYLIVIYFTEIPSNVIIAGQPVNSRPARIVIQKENKFEYSVDMNIEDTKTLFDAHKKNYEYFYYKTYYGIPQRTITVEIQTLNGWSVVSNLTVRRTFTNKPPDMLKQNNTTLIRPDIEPVLNGVEIKWSHPPGEWDINYFMLLVAGDVKANTETFAQFKTRISLAFTATRYRTNASYSYGSIIYPQDLNGHCYKCTIPGVTGNSIFTFPKPSSGLHHPTYNEPNGVEWTHYSILRQKKIASQITVDSTEDAIDSASYEIGVRGLDRKNRFYTAIVPYDVYGGGTISDISDIFKPGASEDDTNTRIIAPKGGTDISVTFDIIGNTNGRVSWTKDIADDRNKYVLQWRGVKNLEAAIQPSQAEEDAGVTSEGYTVIKGMEFVDVDDNATLNGYTLKDLKTGYKYFARVKYFNKAEQFGEWSKKDDGIEVWSTHSTSVVGVTADDFDWEFKKYIYEGNFSSTNYNTVAWAKGAGTGKLKFKKANGTTTDYIITDDNTGAITVPSYIIHPGDAPNANTKFKVISVSDYWAGSISGKTPMAFINPSSDTQQKCFYSRFSDKKDFMINSSFISALSIVTGMLQAGAVTAEKISVTNLAALSAILGSLTMSDTSGSSISMQDSAGDTRIFLSTRSGSKPIIRISKNGKDASNILTQSECIFTSEDNFANPITYNKVLDEFIYVIPDHADWQDLVVAAGQNIWSQYDKFQVGTDFPSGYGIANSREVTGFFFNDSGTIYAVDIQTPILGSTESNDSACFQFVRLEYSTIASLGRIIIQRVCVNPLSISRTLPSLVGNKIKVTVYADEVG